MRLLSTLVALLLASSSYATEKATTYDPPVDLRDKYRLHLEKASKGDLDAVYEVGDALYGGAGVKSDKREGLKYIRMAAASGNTQAICRLENIYYFGVVGAVPSD